jgi:hypothetical protein
MRSLRALAITLAAGLTLGGCASYYGGYGGYGNGGYGGLSVGIGTGGGYYDPYYGGGYYGSYYGGSPYWGWNDGYYYPGTGYYVYDSYRRPHMWSDSQRSYWTQRRAVTGTTSTVRTTSVRPNWSGFNRSRTTAATTAGTITATTTTTTINRPDRHQHNQARVEQQQSVSTDATTTDRPRRRH